MDQAFVAASALHAGFQLTVTVLVYPALAQRSAPEWAAAHQRHSRAITPLVALVYGLLVVSAVAVVAEGPSAGQWVAVAGGGVAIAVTAVGAAPLHGRLSQRDDVLVRRLLVVDRWRCAAAVLGAVAAVVAG